MLVTIITGEGESADDVAKVCNKFVDDKTVEVKEINRKMRFTPFGEERETSILITMRKNKKGALNV